MNQNYIQQPQIITVPIRNETEAMNYPVGLGYTVLLLDFEGGKFWTKTNTTGIPETPREFEFKEIIKQPQSSRLDNLVSRDEFATLSKNLASLSNQVNKLVNELGSDT